MSVFTETEIEYLREHKLGRLATADRDGQPHATPLTYVFNEEEDSVDVGGLDFGRRKKWRDMQENPRVAFLVDDVIGPPRRARAIEVRGDAELHETGGESINPRFPSFAPPVRPDPAHPDRELGTRGGRDDRRRDVRRAAPPGPRRSTAGAPRRDRRLRSPGSTAASGEGDVGAGERALRRSCARSWSPSPSPPCRPSR